MAKNKDLAAVERDIMKLQDLVKTQSLKKSSMNWGPLVYSSNPSSLSLFLIDSRMKSALFWYPYFEVLTTSSILLINVVGIDTVVYFLSFVGFLGITYP